VVGLVVGVGAFVLSGDDGDDDAASGSSEPSERSVASESDSTTTTAPEAVPTDPPESVVVEILTTPACSEGRRHVAEQSRASFDAGCTDGAVDGEPSVQVEDNDGDVATVTVTYSVEGRSTTDEVSLTIEDGTWKVLMWNRPDGTPWIHPT
jgi:hypothetical protein